MPNSVNLFEFIGVAIFL